jgi:predicted SnoaL-like aldol condensation-catalyzing enzyme
VSEANDRMLALSDRWWNEVWRDGRLDVIHDILADPFVRHTATGSETLPAATYRARIAEFQRALSRAVTRIDDRAVNGDRVWTRATSTGINRETGEKAVVTWLIVQRIEDDRIAEHWVATFPGIDWTR